MGETNKPTSPALGSGVGTYDIDSIGTVRDLKLVRLRPMLYLRDVEENGQIHTGFEIIDNTIDEAASMGNINDVPITIVMCRDAANKTYQLIIRDAGRGIPIGTNSAGINVFLNATTVLNSSAKFGMNKAYVASGGLNGVGLKLAAGTALVFRAISHRPDQTASILVRQGDHEKTDVRTPGPWRGGQTGVTVAYEPDKKIFQAIDQFAESGYIAIIERLKRYVFFRQYNISFYISETPLPQTYWTAPAFEAEDILDKVISQSNLVWSAGNGYDREQWLKTYFNITRPLAWQWDFVLEDADDDARLKNVIARLFYVKFERTGGRMSLVNNIPVDDPSSYQFAIFQDILIKHLAPFITDKKIREFCLKSYKLPLFIAMDVKFDGAKFVGNTKEQFKDSDFRGPFRALVDEYVSSDEGRRMMQQMYQQLEDDIKQKYAESLGTKTSTKPVGRLFELLKKPKNFFNCSNKGGYKELFLVEGESAGGCNKYDKEYQALYLMAGKPTNAIKLFPIGTPKSAIVDELLDHPVYQDLFTIINFNPMKPNLDELTFSRVNLMTDADRVYSLSAQLEIVGIEPL